MSRLPLLLLSALICASPVLAADPPAAAPATPAEAAKAKPEAFNIRSILDARQVYYIHDDTWFTPEVLAKLQAAEGKWPSNNTVRVYVGRFAGHEKDIEKAEKYLVGNPDPLARKYLLHTYVEHALDAKFCAAYDKTPMFSLFGEHRIDLALKAGDWAAVEKVIVTGQGPEAAVNRLMDVGIKNDKILWTYEALGRLALRIPADEQGSKILTRIFAERDKLKVLFPAVIP